MAMESRTNPTRQRSFGLDMNQLTLSMFVNRNAEDASQALMV